MQELFYLHVASQFHEPLCILFRAVPLRKLDPEELQGTLKVCQKQVILRCLEKERELCREKVLWFKAAQEAFYNPSSFLVPRKQFSPPSEPHAHLYCQGQRPSTVLLE